MERIEALQLKVPDVEGIDCDWYIIAPEYNYCFWMFAKDLDISYTNREIAELLGLPPDQVDKISAAALQKWKEMKDSQVMQDFREALQDSVARKDESAVHYPDQLGELVHKSAIADLGQQEEAEVEEGAEVKPKKKSKLKSKIKKKACKKTQLYGLYGREALKRLAESKK